MQFADNRDVCAEVVRYFRISLVDDKIDEVKTKRRVLLSIALANPKLADIAIDELWKSMTTLQPIVLVFNSSSTSDNTSTGNLSYVDDTTWEFGISESNRQAAVNRATSYLSRIRHLHFLEFPHCQEYRLWQALSSFGSLRLLCPSLQSLSLGIDIEPPQVAYHIIPLISPTLRTINLYSSGGSSFDSEMTASIVLDVLKHHNVEISSISFKGLASFRVVQRIMKFPSLISAVVRDTRRRPASASDQVTGNHITQFPALANLTSLDIGLGLYDTPENAGNWFESLVCLGYLTLRGSLRSILRCFTNRTPISSIHSFRLQIDALGKPRKSTDMADLIDQISLILPSLHSLHVEMETRDRFDPLTVEQVLLLRERPMQALVLRDCLVINSSDDLIEILKAWPTLRCLRILPRFGVGVASIILPYLSRSASFLCDATLPIDLSSLLDSHHPSFDSDVCVVCPLQHLAFAPSFPRPENLKDNLKLAHTIVTLFPRIKTVTIDGDELDLLQDAQTIIETIQDILNSPPRRSDCLFHH